MRALFASVAAARGGSAVTQAGEDRSRPSGHRDPDARGYFGAFGGRFVPETLVEPIAALEREYFRVRARSGLPAGARCAPAALRRTADAALRGLAPRARQGPRPHLPQARRPDAHRRAQDQQRARPGAARRAHGQAPHRGGDRGAGSTASPPRPPARSSGSTATSTWARRTWSGRRPTCCGWSCSAPPCAASTRAAARSRTPSTRRCATGSRTSTTRTTCSARRSGRTRTR